MAKARVIGEPHYELVLTASEASTLLAVCRRIGGDPSHEGRKCMEAIQYALENVRVREADHKVSRQNRSIWFDDRGTNE